MIRRFSPDLILAVGPYSMPGIILQRIAAIPGRPPIIGWVGDTFSAEDARVAASLDAIGYTDSGMLALHQEWNLPCRAAYVPHAANPRLAPTGSSSTPPRNLITFVANPTDQRRALVRQVRTSIVLYGPGWGSEPPSHHEIHARFVGIAELATIYASHLAALNIRHERNVLLGLNQRHFDPYLAATPVVSDAQPDLERCFEPGREVLVYRDAGELNEIYARLQTDPATAAAIGERGRQRVLAEHTYARRLEQLMKLV